MFSSVEPSVFAWGVFARVFLRIAWVFLRISVDFLSLAILRKNVNICKRKSKSEQKTK